jgi:hypothetical protein
MFDRREGRIVRLVPIKSRLGKMITILVGVPVIAGSINLLDLQRNTTDGMSMQMSMILSNRMAGSLSSLEIDRME